METIASRLAGILNQVASAAKQSGREAGDVELIAVSKTHPAESIREAWDAGQPVFGESRVQEALAKIPALPQALRWQFIGHLQSNKIRKALPHFELFHGVDSADLAMAMDRIAGELGVRPRILLEVNVAGEATKFGFDPATLRASFDELLGLRHVDVEGLMAIPPAVEKIEDARRYFVTLRELRDQLANDSGAPLSTLSMGMSDDFPVAIAEGSTMVRVGTAIFGRRPKPLEPGQTH
jgi:pyridoxal phosphate enzyme (YggS family)